MGLREGPKSIDDASQEPSIHSPKAMPSFYGPLGAHSRKVPDRAIEGLLYEFHIGYSILGGHRLDWCSSMIGRTASNAAASLVRKGTT